MTPPPVRLTYMSASIPDGYTIWKDAKGRKYRLNYPEQLELREFEGKGYSIENRYDSGTGKPMVMTISRKLFNKYLVDAKPQPRPKLRVCVIPGTTQKCDEYHIERAYATPNALLQATKRALIKVVGNADDLTCLAVKHSPYKGGSVPITAEFHQKMTVRQAILKNGRYWQDASAGTIIDVDMDSHIYVAQRW